MPLGIATHQAADLLSLKLPALQHIIDYSPATVAPATPVVDAIALMSQAQGSSCLLSNRNPLPFSSQFRQEQASCVLVVEGSQLVGIFTKRDVVRLISRGVDLSRTSIAEVMTQPVMTLKQSQAEDIFTVLSLLRQHGVGHLPIVDDQGQFVGLVTREIIRQVLQPMHMLKLQYVSEVMSTQVIYAPLTASVLSVAQLMINRNISCVVIAETDALGRVIPMGMITEQDVVQFQVLELDLVQIQAQAVMSTPLFCLSPKDSLWVAYQEMQRRHLQRFVVTGDQGELVGIMTQTNFLQALDPIKLFGVITALQQQVEEHRAELVQVNQQLYQAHDEIERRVQEHMVELSQANALLQQEIENRQQTEERMKFQTYVLSQVNDAVLAIDHQNRITYWNEGAERLYNLKAEDVLGRRLEEAYRDRWVKAEDEQVASHALAATGIWRGEKIHIKKNREEIYVESSISVLTDDNDIDTGFLVIARDMTQRKQSEQEHQQLLSQKQVALAEAEAAKNQSIDILERITDCFLMLDRQWRLTYVNHQAARILQRSQDQLIGKNIWEEFPDAVNLAFYRESHQALRQQVPVEFEEFYPPLNTWCKVKVYPNPDGLAIYFQDITERKRAERAEEALRQSEEKARRQLAEIEGIYATAPIGLCFVDTNLRYIRVNEHLAEINGLPVSAHIGRTARELIPELSQELDPLLEQVIQTGLPVVNHEVHSTTLAQPGIERDWLVNFFPLKGTDGQLLGVNSMVQDITERKQAQQKINEQAALLDITTDAILVRNLENQILFWNSSAEHLYGWQAAEAIGKNANELLFQGRSPQLEEALLTVFKRGLWRGELHQVTKDGKNIIVQSRWTLVRDETGQPNSILVVNTDITEKKQLEVHFLRNQRLESLGTLAAGIAHDFNNILTPMLTTAYLLSLKLPNLDEQSRQLLKILEDNSQRGADLVKQILFFAQGVEGKRIPQQVKHLLKEIERIVKSTFPKSIEINTCLLRENLWKVWADPTQIHQVLLNLCVNARDAMPNGGTLSLSAENIFIDENYVKMNLNAQVGSFVVITVSDTGCGIPPEVLERIFEPFFTTKESGKGTGLGLSTVIGIVKNHGGFVEVYSKVGKGSQFKVYLPVSDTAATQEAFDSEMPGGNGELILIVDDEVSILETTKISLENYNYRILTASNSIEAFSLYALHKNEISVVLMDIQMPALDGLSTIRILQKMNPSVKIIAISGLESNREALNAVGTALKAFLSKPYIIRELLTTIKHVLTEP
ncbi:hypothetical protein BZZ01_13695 [Nostocales cyanobacterium HT-58-2]|nr:hypothetical protein BZZ01_13695 [Nostocales cyanobacterium HT-58-2]